MTTQYTPQHNFTPFAAIGASIMRQGGVIAYPTEAVWGLGCDPYNESAVMDILALKQRSVAKGLILVASSIEQFAPQLEGLSESQRTQLAQSWPGPVTWLVPKNSATPLWVSGQHHAVALRVSNHPFVRQLCEAFGGPVVSTSANPQAKPAAQHAWQVQRYFNGHTRLDWIAKGRTGQGRKPSTIIDLSTGKMLR